MSAIVDEKSVSSVFSVETQLNRIFGLEYDSFQPETSSFDKLEYQTVYTHNKDNILLKEFIYCGHDGYDRYGPESDLWSVYILVKTKDGNIYLQRWYGENWFRENWGLELEKEIKITDKESFNNCIRTLGKFFTSVRCVGNNWCDYRLDEYTKESEEKYSHLYPDGYFVGACCKLTPDARGYYVPMPGEQYVMFITGFDSYGTGDFKLKCVKI
jgi:hypothetical protein